MGTIFKLDGRVVELGESERDSASELRQGRRHTVHVRKYAFIVIEDSQGVRHELPSCSMTGEAALHKLDVGADVELLYGGPIPAAKKQSSGIGRATVVYAMRVVNVTGWMGAEVADITGAMAWELWKAAGIFLALTPVLALGTFFAAGVGGLFTLWHCIQAVRGAVKLSSVSDVREAIAQASCELDAQEPTPGSTKQVAAAVPTR